MYNIGDRVLQSGHVVTVGEKVMIAGNQAVVVAVGRNVYKVEYDLYATVIKEDG